MHGFERIDIAEIAPGVWRSAHDERNDRPALGAVVGTERVLMVDSGASPRHALAFVEALRDASGRAPDLVALTHWHWDHSFGLSALGVPALAHRATFDALARMRTWAWDDRSLAARVASGEEIEFCARMIAVEYGTARDIRIAMPTIMVEERLELELGDRSVLLEWIPNDHSADGLVILDRATGTAFLGDILGPAYYERPVAYRSGRFLSLVDRLLALPAATFAEGHDDPLSRSGLLRELAAHLAVARAVEDGERSRPTLARLAADADPEAEPAELHRIAAFFLSGATAS
ncbi:MAG: MBL fold metallo-hydrolase [Spirochaetales bacterium]|nr:MBL fold metallo-hydrolase [Spirochaetales bacterium]